MHRYLLSELQQHYQANRQMLFVSGPRQVGKTTLARALGEAFEHSRYFNWDNLSDRDLILQGPAAIAQKMGLERMQSSKPICVFDELHKYPRWRDFLKGFFDQYENQINILVTGSVSLETFKRGGDSLMGRYFPYRLHPVSVAELTSNQPDGLINPNPVEIAPEQWNRLCQYGGFPEPYIKDSTRFYNRWRALRTEQLFREDLRGLTRIQELDQVEMLAQLLCNQAGQLTSYSSLAKSIRVSVDTIRRWISTLESLYYCFSIRPWHTNVARALRKEPKYYLWDWSQIENPGARFENMVASALLKAVHYWTEKGLGQFELHFIRDKEKREVDFLVTQDNTPWFLVEVKSSQAAALSPSLSYFQQKTQAKHAFQVAMDMGFVAGDCFQYQQPVIVPAKTLLAQWV